MIDHLSDLGDIIIIIKVLVTLHVTQPSAVLSMKRHKNHLKSALGLSVRPWEALQKASQADRKRKSVTYFSNV